LRAHSAGRRRGRLNQIGIDVGGTFTDVFLVAGDGQLVVHKVPSTPTDIASCVLDAMQGACTKATLGLDDLDMVFHGSTVATNALLQRSGAKVGLITTRGFRDVLHIARHKRPLNFSLYQELPWQKWPLVPRRLRIPVTERMGAPSGEVATPLAEEEVRAAIAELARQGVEAVAVCFLHSYLNPAHEQRVAELLAEELPDVFVSLRHNVCPEYREYEAFNTVAVNAYVGPATGQYLGRLTTRLAEAGVAAEIHFMTSSGGVEPGRVVSLKPVNMLLSGPVAGVVGGMAAGKSAGFENVITFDVGGTSADIGVIHRGVVRHKHWLDNQIGGLHLRLSMVDVSAIGAGGGSIAYLDRGGMLQVGPRSAGAEPGPVCYGQGGTQPTVTDAQLVLGRLSESAFLGGRMPISRLLAERAIEEQVAAPLGLSITEAAAGIVRIATSHMTGAIELNSVRRGYDPREFALVAFGGAGPMFAPDIATELQIPDIVAPRFPGIASAMGLLGADVVHTYPGTVVSLLANVSHDDLQRRFDAMEQQARRQLEADGFDLSDTSVQRFTECRYAGQGYEIRDEAPLGTVDDAWVAEVTERFHQVHEREYANAFRDSEVELVNIGVIGVGRIVEPEVPEVRAARAGSTPEPTGERDVWFEGAGVTASRVYERALLLAGHGIGGPGVIEQEDSTVLVPPGWHARVDLPGNIVISRRGKEA
jgi:N-methylhydantoinase A/oxoprolinase/acetone carboxylase beta subunit